MHRNLPGSSFRGIFQARILEWVAIDGLDVLNLTCVLFHFHFSASVIFFNPPFWIKGCFLVFEITKGNFPTVLCILKDHLSFHYFLHIFKAMPVISPQHTQILYRQTHTHLFNVSSWILLCCDYHLGLIISWYFLHWQKLMPRKPRPFQRSSPSLQHLYLQSSWIRRQDELNNLMQHST